MAIGLLVNESDPTLDLFVNEYRADIGTGDATSLATISADARMSGHLRFRHDGVLTAIELLPGLIRALDLDLETEIYCKNGEVVTTGQPIAAIGGNARHLLGLERTLLNGLQILCGIATETRRWVSELPDRIRILDTRKTHPGLRAWERRAVADGGGCNHRYNLAAAIMIKDNHLAMHQNVGAAVIAAKNAFPGLYLICEVESLDAAEQAIDAGATHLLIDNQIIADWPKFWNAISDDITLEFSGGIRFDVISSIPEPPRTIYISTSQTVLSAAPLDIGLDIIQ